VIAAARFAPARGRVRPLQFVPRAAFPIAAACAVARAVEASLRELLGACELTVGEPAAVSRAAWAELTRDALLVVRRGRPADAVLVIPPADARRLVLYAFGEGAAPHAAGACSALERQALERIAARCAEAFAPVCEGPSPPAVRVPPDEVPPCAVYVDLRVRAPIAVTVGVGLTRDLPDPPPGAALDAGSLDDVTLQARAVFAEGMMDAVEFVRLRPGHVVRLDTKVGAAASLNVGGTRLAGGVVGAVGSRTAFLVHDVAPGAHP
jgi:flagellar motor switch/type III secretory pathway protein FliN